MLLKVATNYFLLVKLFFTGVSLKIVIIIISFSKLFEMLYESSALLIILCGKIYNFVIKS